MPLQIPTRAQELVTEVTETLSHTRGVTQGEVLRALSFGLGKIVRALKAVAPQQMVAFADNFSLPANTREIDLSGLNPPVSRLSRLILRQDGGRERSVVFRHRGMQAPEFEGREDAAGSHQVVLYDILRGFFPMPYTTVRILLEDPGEFTVDDVSTFEVGALIEIVESGPLQPVTATATVPNDYLGTVVQIRDRVLGILKVAPIPDPLPQEDVTQVRRIRTTILLLANPPTETITGKLVYKYEATRLTRVDQLLPPNVEPYRDAIVYYALSQLLQATNETDAQRWFQQAEEMKAELFQDADPLSDQNAQALSSGMGGNEY